MTILVIDVGSSSARVLLFDDKAQMLEDALVSHRYRFQTEPQGASTITAQTLQAAVEHSIDEILTRSAAINSPIVAVAMTTFVGNMLGVDADGTALTPIFTYADARSAEDVNQLKTKVDPLVVHQRTGCMLHTAYRPAQLHWLARTQPDLWRDVQQWTDFGSYLYRQWFGRRVPCSYSVASWSGLLNRTNLIWDAEWLDFLELSPEKFPPLVDYDAPQQGLLPNYTARWGALRDVPFFLAIGDGAAANVGLGAVKTGQIALTVGTTAAPAPNYRCYTANNPQWLVELSCDRSTTSCGWGN